MLALCGLVTIPFVAGPLRRRVLADWETFEPAFVRVLFDGFMIGSLTYVVLFKPFTRTSFLFFWSVFGTAVAVGLWWGPRLTSRCPRSLLRLTDVIIFNVCLAVLLAEVGLRIYDNFFPSQVLARSEKVRESISRNRLTPGSEHVGSIVNSRGFVDTEPRSTSARRLVV